MTTREKAEKIVRQEGGCAGFHCCSDGEPCPLCRSDLSCAGGGDANHRVVVARKWLAEHPEEPSAESGDIAKLQQIAGGSCAGWPCDQCPLHDWHKVRSCGVGGFGRIGNPETIAEAKRQLRERGEECEGGPCTAHAAPMSEIASVQSAMARAMSQSITSMIRGFSITPQTLVEKRRETRRRLLGL